MGNSDIADYILENMMVLYRKADTVYLKRMKAMELTKQKTVDIVIPNKFFLY